MELDNITEEDWKKLAPELARNTFPVDSLVTFRYALRENFGKVKGYTPTGMIVIIPGELDEVKRKLFGAYWEIDYDPNSFRPQPYDRLTSNPKHVIKFTPFYSTVRSKSEISWYRSEAGILRPLTPNDDKLFHDTQLNY